MSDFQMNPNSQEYRVRPIGIIRTPHKSSEGAPRQPIYADNAEGTIEIYPEYREGLTDLDGFGWIWVLFWCDRARPFRLKVIPYADTVERGLFATRAPSRPNPIGISPLKLLNVDRVKGLIKVAGVDLLDGTPIIDLKPYSPGIDCIEDAKSGWLDNVKHKTEKSDTRFDKSD